MDKLVSRQLFRLPNVVGFGHGHKHIGGVNSNQECLTILVSKKLPPEQLRVQHLIPQTIDSIFTDVIEVGRLFAHESTQAAESLTRGSRLRPIPPGMSIGHYRVSAGTFGALVYDQDNKPLILSNNHVLANSSNGRDMRARAGDKILQPGAADGGRSAYNVCAKLKSFVPLSPLNVVDCALAEPIDTKDVSNEILEIGKVIGVGKVSLGQDVKKSGRTTGFTTGTVRTLNVTANIEYGPGRSYRFENQIVTTVMSAPGDSGSLILDMDNRAIGLLFAGSDSVTIINPIETVLEKLQVHF